MASFEQAVILFNHQAFFECHEELEDLWLPLPAGAEKEFLQGLLQVGVGFYHWERGNFVGARNKLQSGLEKLTLVANQTIYHPPIALAPFIQTTRGLFDSLLEQGADHLRPWSAEALPQIDLRH